MVTQCELYWFCVDSVAWCFQAEALSRLGYSSFCLYAAMYSLLARWRDPSSDIPITTHIPQSSTLRLLFSALPPFK